MTPLNYTEVSTLAKPFLSLGNDKPVIVKVLTAQRKGRPNPMSKMEPGMVVDVLLLARGLEELEEPQQFEMGLGAVASQNMEKQFPGEKLVGRVFKVVKHAKTGGGKANPMTVVELKLGPSTK